MIEQSAETQKEITKTPNTETQVPITKSIITERIFRFVISMFVMCLKKLGKFPIIDRSAQDWIAQPFRRLLQTFPLTQVQKKRKKVHDQIYIQNIRKNVITVNKKPILNKLFIN